MDRIVLFFAVDLELVKGVRDDGPKAGYHRGHQKSYG